MNKPYTLSAERVHELFLKALPGEGADLAKVTLVTGITMKVGMSKSVIAENKGEIGQMVMQMEDAFMKTKGGGMSFLRMCYDRRNVHWAEHPTMQELVFLGIASGYMEELSLPGIPRVEQMQMMPGGVPYYVVRDDLLETAISTTDEA